MFTRHHVCTGHRASIYTLAWSHRSGHFLSAGGDGWVVEWNLEDPEIGRVIAQVDAQIFSMAVSPPDWPDPLILVGNMTGGLHWIAREAPDQTKNIQHHHKGIFDILWIGDAVFTVGGDGAITRWDAHAQRAAETYQLSNQSLRCLSYHPEQDLLAAGGSDGKIYLLERATLRLIHAFQAHDSSVFTLQWLPDKVCLLSGGRDAMLKVWDAHYRNISAQPAHWYTINHLQLSPDGAAFATAARDKTIKIWSADDFRLLKVLDTLRDGCHHNSVNRLLWQGDTLVSCSDDRTVMIWTREHAHSAL